MHQIQTFPLKWPDFHKGRHPRLCFGSLKQHCRPSGMSCLDLKHSQPRQHIRINAVPLTRSKENSFHFSEVHWNASTHCWGGIKEKETTLTNKINVLSAACAAVSCHLALSLALMLIHSITHILGANGYNIGNLLTISSWFKHLRFSIT